MNKTQDALKLALECIEAWDRGGNASDYWRDRFDAITAIKEALAEQPAQGCEFCSHSLYAGTKCKNCGREQPAQPSKPLTDEEIWDEVKAADLDWQTGWSLDEDASNRYITFARAIEAAHGIKGGT